MGQTIWRPGQPIGGPIQRRFFSSCVRRVHFLRNSTEFNDMRAECQIIKISHSFLTVLIIYHQLPEIAQSLAPQSLKNRSPVAPWSAESVLLKFFLASEAANFNPPSKIAFQWMNLQKYFSLNIHQDYLAYLTHQAFCILYILHRDLLIHITPHKGKAVTTTTFILVYFMQMTHQILIMKTLPNC